MHTEEGSAEEAQLRTWLDEGWLRPTDLVKLDGQWTTFDGAHLFEQQLAELALERRARLYRRLGWALFLFVGTVLMVRRLL